MLCDVIQEQHTNEGCLCLRSSLWRGHSLRSLGGVQVVEVASRNYRRFLLRRSPFITVASWGRRPPPRRPGEPCAAPPCGLLFFPVFIQHFIQPKAPKTATAGQLQLCGRDARCTIASQQWCHQSLPVLSNDQQALLGLHEKYSIIRNTRLWRSQFGPLGCCAQMVALQCAGEAHRCERAQIYRLQPSPVTVSCITL